MWCESTESTIHASSDLEVLAEFAESEAIIGVCSMSHHEESAIVHVSRIGGVVCELSAC